MHHPYPYLSVQIITYITGLQLIAMETKLKVSMEVERITWVSVCLKWKWGFVWSICPKCWNVSFSSKCNESFWEGLVFTNVKSRDYLWLVCGGCMNSWGSFGWILTHTKKMSCWKRVCSSTQIKSLDWWREWIEKISVCFSWYFRHWEKQFILNVTQ